MRILQPYTAAARVRLGCRSLFRNDADSCIMGHVASGRAQARKEVLLRGIRALPLHALRAVGFYHGIGCMPFRLLGIAQARHAVRLRWLPVLLLRRGVGVPRRLLHRRRRGAGRGVRGGHVAGARGDGRRVPHVVLASGMRLPGRGAPCVQGGAGRAVRGGERGRAGAAARGRFAASCSTSRASCTCSGCCCSPGSASS